MDWVATVKLAVEIAGMIISTGTLAGKVYGWLSSLIQNSHDKRAEMLWEQFLKSPKEHATDLADVLSKLHPADDPLLRGYVLGTLADSSRNRTADVYSLLASPSYMREDVADIYAKLDPRGPLPTDDQVTLSRKLVLYAATRKRRWDQLVSLMVEKNPDVVHELAGLGN